MARKDLLKALIENSNAEKPELENPVNSNDSTIRRSRGAVGAVGRSISDLKNKSVLELDAQNIKADGLDDRIGGDAHDDLTLLESIREYGQQVPILVRPDPDQEGAYLIVYGRRRLAALRKLGLPVKAIIRDLDDASAIMAQGQENTARRNLSFIEKARFGKQMEREGYNRKIICDALSIDKTVISRMFNVIENIPEEWIISIGAAPSIGRDRWVALAELIAKGRVEFDLTQLDDVSLSSDQRFEKAFRYFYEFQKKSKNLKQSNTILLGENGTQLGTINTTNGLIKLEFDSKQNGGFESWLIERIPRIHSDFIANKSKR